MRKIAFRPSRRRKVLGSVGFDGGHDPADHDLSRQATFEQRDTRYREFSDANPRRKQKPKR